MKTTLKMLPVLLILSNVLTQAGPYPQSDFIAGMEVDWKTHRRGALGSDNFQLTWAGDGQLYGAWGDGSGFHSVDISLGVSRLCGDGGP